MHQPQAATGGETAIQHGLLAKRGSAQLARTTHDAEAVAGNVLVLCFPLASLPPADESDLVRARLQRPRSEGGRPDAIVVSYATSYARAVL